MADLTHASVFTGLGGFDIASEAIGWKNLFTCEIDEFCNRILNYYWKDVEHYGDIKKTDFRKWRGKLDVLSGGFPCQPFSGAGKKKGANDNRYLWPEMLKAIDQSRPTWVVGENVVGITRLVFPGKTSYVESQTNVLEENYEIETEEQQFILEGIYQDLEARGYSVQSFIIPACAIGAPHRRDRLWIVANSNGKRCGSGSDNREKRQVQNNINGDAKKNKPEWNRRDCRLSPPSTAITNTTRFRLERGKGKRYKSGRSGQNNTEITITGCCRGIIRSNWQEFTTQSAICNGDDGLPTELDGITFSNWRKESIKAGGNSIVPHLAYEIFKSIDSCYE